MKFIQVNQELEQFYYNAERVEQITLSNSDDVTTITLKLINMEEPHIFFVNSVTQAKFCVDINCDLDLFLQGKRGDLFIFHADYVSSEGGCL